MADRVSIVIVAHNQLDYCRRCVDSVRAHTRPPMELILVDNGSSDGVGAWFDTVPGARVIHTGENLGYPAGANRGLDRATGHPLLLNSDTVVPPAWLERLEAALFSAPDVGMAGPVSNCVSGIQQVPGPPGDAPGHIAAWARARAETCAGRRTETERLVGFCVLIRRDAFERVGGLDERFGLGNYEDDDYCLRLRLAGYRLVIAEDCAIYHYGSRSFAGIGLAGAAFDHLLNENEARFLAKWRDTDPALLPALYRGRIHAARGAQAHAAGALLDSARHYAEAVRACPGDAGYRNDLGAVLWTLGEHEGAFAQFRLAVRLRPDHAVAVRNLAEAAAVLGRSTEALPPPGTHEAPQS